MSAEPRDPYTHIHQPRPVHEPSPVAVAALLIAGSIALALLVLQVVADGRRGFISGQPNYFASQPAAPVKHE